jgi:prevent-host-death family protein
MATVKIAYAKAHLPELLARVALGERIVISRYNTPIAELVPLPEKPKRKFGTGKGKVRILDPHCFDPMTPVEVGAFLEGRPVTWHPGLRLLTSRATGPKRVRQPRRWQAKIAGAQDLLQ